MPASVTEIGDYAFGFRPAEDAGDEETPPVLQADFTLSGTPRSAAKSYAKANGVRFSQQGIDTRLIAVILAAAAGLAAVGVIVQMILRARRQAAEAPEVPRPEEEYDENYTSILGEEGDPYDRSYGFTVGDDEADAPEDADHPGSDEDGGDE